MIKGLLGFIRSHSIALLVTLFLLGIVSHGVTLSYSPLHWIDEVQINEIAQGGIGKKQSSWSMCLLKTDGALDAQTWAVYYLGGACSELGYRLFGAVGPRVVMLVGVMLASGLFFFYLTRKTGSVRLAAVIAFLFACFPPLIQSVRGGRADVLAFVCVFASLSILVLKPDSWLYRCRTFLAGAFAAMACFCWVTAILVLPLIAWELYDQTWYKREWRAGIRGGLLMAAGAVAATVVLLLPFFANFSETVSTFELILKSNTQMGQGAMNIFALVSALLDAPGVYLLGILAVFCCPKRFWPLILAIVLFLLFCAYRIYVFRTLYLAPYAFVALALVVANIRSRGLKLCAFAVLGMVGLYSYGYAVVLRNGVDFFARPYRDYSRVEVVCEEVIGRDVRIYSDTFQLYYVGRALGWHQIRTAFGAIHRDVLAQTDYFITEREELSDQEQCVLEDQGFRLIETIDCRPNRSMTCIEQILNKVGRLRPLGPYYLYKRMPGQDAREGVSALSPSEVGVFAIRDEPF